MAGYHNITLKLMYFAGDTPEWRIYCDDGQYVTAKTLDEIPSKIKFLLRDSAQLVLKQLDTENP